MAFDAASFLLGIPKGTPEVFAVAETRVSITGTPVEDATVDEAYAGFSVTGHDGTTPYVYSIAAGVLPNGVALNASTGAVAGTPTEAGTFADIVLRVTDANGFYADLAPFSLTPVDGGGGGAYVAQAVHFDDASFLRIEALTASDSPYMTFSLFFRCTEAAIGEASLLSLLDFYPAGDEDIVGFSNAGGGTGQLAGSFDDNPDNGQSFGYDSVATPNSPAFNGEWHSLVFSVDFDHEGNAKLGAAYLDRTLIANGGCVGHPDKPAFSFKFSGATVGVPDTTEDYPVLPEVDLAVYQVFVGTKIVQADNTILSADLDNFVTTENKPVDPAVAASAYGAPTILFDGDATGFATNQGTGGAFAVTGAITDADSSPSA